MTKDENNSHIPIPGTVHLVDLQGTLRAAHATGTKTAHDIVLVPAPSADPDDPLNWSPSRKLLSTVCQCVYVLMVGIASAAIYSVLVPISDATGLTLGELNAGTGYMFLAFGWGCLFWQPLALQYGKRPVYLFSILATCAIQVWAPYTKNNGQWIANKVLQGFVGAPIESLCEISVTDIYFQHERGFYIGLYALLLAGSNFFAPVWAGFAADSQGWQWVLYYCAIFCGAGYIFLFFFMEETNYPNRISAIPPGSPPSIERLENAEFDQSPDTIVEKSIILPETAVGATDTAEGLTLAASNKSFIVKMKLFQSRDLHQPNNLLGMVTRPLIFLTFPVIFYAGFSYGSNLVWFNVLNATASSILSYPPYSFPASLVGVAYCSPLVGVSLASWYTGWFGDRFVLRLARRNGGILESEHRLWLFTPCLLLVPFGLLLWGVGAAHSVHWFGVVFAMGVISATNVIGLQLSVSYCLDSYRAFGGEAMVTVILVRNTMSFAIGYGITPWLKGMGLQNTFILAAFVGMLQVASFLVFVKWGKRMREASVPRYTYYLDQMKRNGMLH